MAKQPKIGDQRAIGTCEICGGTEYEVYEPTTSFNVAGAYAWKLLRHAYTQNRTLCIAELAKRIEALEPKGRKKK